MGGWKGKRRVYTLSMGHRIHVLSYDGFERVGGWVGGWFGWVGGKGKRRVCTLFMGDWIHVLLCDGFERVGKPTHSPTHLPIAHSSAFEPPRSPLSTHPPTHLPLQVDVKHFLDRHGSNANSPSNHHRYCYQLWVAQVDIEKAHPPTHLPTY